MTSGTLNHFRGNEGIPTGDGSGCRGEDDVSGNGLVHPDGHRFPEAEDHDGDANEHGEGRHQGRNGNGRARQGVIYVVARQPSLGLEEPLHHGSEEGVEPPGSSRSDQRESDQDQKGRGEPEDGPSQNRFLEREDEGESQGPQPGQHERSDMHPHLPLQVVQGKGLPRFGPSGLSGGACGRSDGDTDGDYGSEKKGYRRYGEALGLHENIEGSHRFRNRSQRELGHDEADPDSQDRAENPQYGTFGQKESKDLTFGNSQAPEDPDLSAPPNHGNGHGIVDEKHAHEEGDETERRQVEPEGADHVFHLSVPGLRPADHDVRGKFLPQAGRNRLHGSSGVYE